MNLSINDFQARRNWPNLKPENFTRTSPDTIDYNCAAWAAGDTERWWWPAPDDPEAYWPDAVPKTSTLDAFEAAYATLGYEKCEASELEPGFERVAVYALNGKPWQDNSLPCTGQASSAILKTSSIRRWKTWKDRSTVIQSSS